MKLLLNNINKIIDFWDDILDDWENFIIESKLVMYPYESIYLWFIEDIWNTELPNDIDNKIYKYIDWEFIEYIEE